MGPSRSSSLRIGDDPSADAGSGRARDVPVCSTAAGPQNAPEAPPLPLGKGKKKINLIKYPKGSDFLNSAVWHAMNVGPTKVGPSYEFIFAERYRLPTGVRIWSLDVLTFYAASVPGMVCFFEVAFDNDLRFPLHPFIKGVLQHFNICPSQLAPNGWGILVGLLAFFRDRGPGVPNVALLLHLFSPTATTEGFIYFSRRSGAPLVISDLPSHIGHGRDDISLSVAPTGNTILLIGTTPWVFLRLGAPLITFVSIGVTLGLICLKPTEYFCPYVFFMFPRCSS